MSTVRWGSRVGRIVVTEILPAAPSVVWKVVSDPRRAADWVEGEGFVRLRPGDDAGPRAKWVSRIWLAGLAFHVRGRRLDWQPQERAKALIEGPFGLRMVETFRLEPHVLGTEWSWARDYSLPWGVLGDWLDRRWAERLLEQRARRSVANLVRLLRPEGEVERPQSALSVFTEKPVDRPWGLDSAPRATPPDRAVGVPNLERQSGPSVQGRGG